MNDLEQQAQGGNGANQGQDDLQKPGVLARKLQLQQALQMLQQMRESGSPLDVQGAQTQATGAQNNLSRLLAALAQQRQGGQLDPAILMRLQQQQ